MPNTNPYAIAPVRGRENAAANDSAQTNIKSAETRRARGRPKGSTTKPRGLLNRETAESVLGTIKPLLSVADYEEIKDAVRKGKSISTLKEVKIMMALMAPPIWQRLVAEANPKKSAIESELEDEIGLEPQQVEMARDLNERVKVWKDLAVLASNLEKTVESETDNRAEPLSEVFKRKGLLIDRFTISGRYGPGGMGGDSDGLGGASDSLGTLPNQLSPRLVNPEDSEEVEATGLFDTDSD